MDEVIRARPFSWRDWLFGDNVVAGYTCAAAKLRSGESQVGKQGSELNILHFLTVSNSLTVADNTVKGAYLI